MDAPLDPAPSDGHDEVARQRRKRRAILSSRSVPGNATLTVGELAEAARAASSAAAGAAGVQRFLVEEGHSRETIAAVLGCLDLAGPDTLGTGTGVTAMPQPSAGQQRLRTLAELEAMLLEE